MNISRQLVMVTLAGSLGVGAACSDSGQAQLDAGERADLRARVRDQATGEDGATADTSEATRDSAADGPADGFVCAPTGDASAFSCLRILILGRSGTNASSNFQAWLQSNGALQVDRIHESPAEAATLVDAATLAPYNALLVDYVQRDYSAAEAEAIRVWVEGGGGLVVLTGHSGGLQARSNTLIAGIGVHYVGGLKTTTLDDFVTHPISASLGPAPGIKFAGGWEVQAIAGSVGGANTVVATLPNSNVAAGVAQERGAGRAFVWGDEWITFDSEWGPSVQILWTNIAAWIAHVN